MSTKTASKLALGALASASTASGAIVVFDINPDRTYENTSFNYVAVDSLNFNNATYTTNATGYGVLFSFGTSYLNVSFDYGSSYDVTVAASAGNTLSLLLLGQSIGSSLSFVETADNSHVDDPNAGTRYMGLRLENGADYNYGWLEFQFTESDFDVRDYTFTRFAFNDVVGQTILAGETTAVPEASTLGFAGGLFGLVALAHARRRKAKQAAASEKFLSLAAGEKLN